MLIDSRLLPPLAALRAFEAVGRLGGIRRAAKELTVDHGVVSRHIRSLEAWVGVELVVRDGAGYSLTEKGEVYHRQIYEALRAVASATGALVKVGDDLKLRLQCIPGFASLWLSDRLGEFIDANRDIDVDFRPSDHSPDFRGQDVDGDIRYLRTWEEVDLPKVVYRLDVARPVVFPVASPACAAGLPPITSPADLLNMPLLHEENDLEWRHWLTAQGVAVPERMPGSRLWHAHLTLAAARQGHGITLANTMLLRDDLAAGRLVKVKLAQGEFAPVLLGTYTFLAREDRWNSPAIARFRRWLWGAVAVFDSDAALAAGAR
ncbi:LysR substrate-binding domain-containing protein [Sphingomonas sp. TX0543]|uniref:LysR substrate-binding domain-containing protein n=1 Tax=unclassified Sphingomonas TaxID=196159 RepID=UPI0020166F54|nr:LysR substrate-binding domain-containing protein [Sphingomonas sp. 3P27F8]